MATLNGIYTFKSVLSFIDILKERDEYNLNKNFTVGSKTFNTFSITRRKGSSFNHIEIKYLSDTEEIEIYTALEQNGRLSKETWFTFDDLSINQIKEISFNNVTVDNDFYLWLYNNIAPTVKIIEDKLNSLKTYIERATGTTYSNLTIAVSDIVSKYLALRGE